uniref:HMA domain-containing protein n=1 Tax=Ananas comosus var. bracteatus TaxID=296719 RepID=A0A6V7QU47_ANACO
MSSTTKQALRFAENLTLPSVQVVVVSANMGCSHCRGRVTQVVSRMNAGLQDYIVDFGKKEVTVRGAVEVDRKKKKKKKKKRNKGVAKRPHKIIENKFPLHIGFFRFMCCSAF